MDDALRERLVCPACRGELRWDISSRHAHRIDDGEARCSSCDSGYPVRDGIGLFLTPNLQRNDLWESAESGLSRYLRQHPEVETQILDSPLTALNPADLFFRGYVLEERGRWGEAEEAFAAARPGLYTPEANACSDALALMERKRHMGRPTIVDLREIVNALLYLTRTGCQWRLLPTDFPNWNTVRYYFDQWTLDRTFIRINDALRERARRKAGRDPEPSAGIIDSQSVKTTEAGGERGFDGGKKVTGRTRHILVDTQGNLVVVIVHPANIPDRNGADWVLEAAREKSTRLRHVWADSGYRGELVEWWQDERGLTIEIVGKRPNQHSFIVAPRRWVVERAFAILGRARRLSKDYEREDLYSESMVYLASIGSLLRRLTGNALTATRYHVISTADGY